MSLEISGSSTSSCLSSSSSEQELEGYDKTIEDLSKLTSEQLAEVKNLIYGATPRLRALSLEETPDETLKRPFREVTQKFVGPNARGRSASVPPRMTLQLEVQESDAVWDVFGRFMEFFSRAAQASILFALERATDAMGNFALKMFSSGAKMVKAVTEFVD